MKDLTLHQEALELKQLGFDEPCFGYYFYNGSFDKWTLNIDNSDLEYLKTISAPTYSQAFRWFREEHNLLCYIRKIGSSYWYNIDAEDGSTLDSEFEGRFDTYEEAELACLRKMIKLIGETNK